jgi:hypothetical protein
MRRRREADATGRALERGLGPFSSAHLTVIVVTIAVLIGFPFAASAVSGSNVFVADSTSGVRAKVSATGSLQASVTGSVTATPAAPSAMVVKFAIAGSTGNSCAFYTPPVGSAFVITAVDQVPVNAASVSEVQLNLLADTSTGCGGTQTSLANGTFATDQPRQLSFNPGIGLKNGHYLDLHNSAATSLNGFVYVYGYTVPAATCTSGCL